jgi:hypothetical protein
MIFNTYFFSMTAKVTRTRLNVNVTLTVSVLFDICVVFSGVF